MKSQLLALHAIVSAWMKPPQTLLAINVEQNGQDRLQTTGCHLAQLTDEVEVYATPVTLIGDCRVDITVADDQLTLFQRRSNQLLYMLGPVGLIEKKLG